VYFQSGFLFVDSDEHNFEVNGDIKDMLDVSRMCCARLHWTSICRCG